MRCGPSAVHYKLQSNYMKPNRMLSFHTSLPGLLLSQIPVRTSAGQDLLRRTTGTSLQFVVIAPNTEPAAKPTPVALTVREKQSSALSPCAIARHTYSVITCWSKPK